MRVGLIGCVTSSKVALLRLMEHMSVEVVAVITKESSLFNNDFEDLSQICNKNAIPCHLEKIKERSKSLAFMKSHTPDVIYCIGWSSLLNDDFLSICKDGVIGFHPAELPSNRGRHPIIWSLSLGLASTASTFFIMEEEADTGPIINQKKILISNDDNATTLYKKILDKMEIQLDEITAKFLKGNIVKVEQDNSKSNNWRKRSMKDGEIDWRMTAIDIHNLIRALSKPYPGAHYNLDDKFISVFKSKVATERYKCNIEPGKVLDIDGKEEKILVKCSGNSAIWVYNEKNLIQIKIGDYL